MYTIKQIPFSVEDYNKSTREIFINLNDHRDIDEEINSIEKLRYIDIKSPTGNVASFVFDRMDKWELIFKSSNGITARFGYK